MDSLLSRRDALKLAGVGALLAAARPLSAMQLPGQRFSLPGTFEGGQYTLPELPYAYDALQPLYDQTTLQIHHTKHHAGYVRGLNATLEKLANARKEKDYGSIQALSRQLAFHGSGHVLHSLFWHSMTPQQPTISEDLAFAMIESFGSVEAGKSHLAEAAVKVAGSGWVILAWEPLSRKLLVLQCENHEKLTVWGVVPLLVCDVWEHAYYLQYRNKRGDWVDAFMKLANWSFATERFRAAVMQ